MSKGYSVGSIFLGAVALASLFVYAFGLFDISDASTIAGNDYKSTTTSSAIASSTKVWLLKSSAGSLGSVIVTMESNPTGYPSLVLYDATSTAVTATTTTIQATSSARKLASFSTSTQTQATYQFDAEFYNGLALEVPAGFTGSYTVTYR